MPRRSAQHSMHERDTSFPLKLPPLIVERAVAAALEEDLSLAGDITTDSIIPAEAQGEAAIVLRKPGVVAGPAASAVDMKAFVPWVHVGRHPEVPLGLAQPSQRQVDPPGATEEMGVPHPRRERPGSEPS